MRGVHTQLDDCFRDIGTSPPYRGKHGLFPARNCGFICARRLMSSRLPIATAAMNISSSVSCGRVAPCSSRKSAPVATSAHYCSTVQNPFPQSSRAILRATWQFLQRANGSGRSWKCTASGRACPCRLRSATACGRRLRSTGRGPSSRPSDRRCGRRSPWRRSPCG